MKTTATLILSAATLISSSAAIASVPNSPTLFSPDQCRGSRMPYPSEIVTTACPDSLVPVMINHVGRHGARYATSPHHFHDVASALEKARTDGTLSSRGAGLLDITRRAIAAGQGHWGELDSLGRAEQQAIATRMFHSVPQLVRNHKIDAISSYVPRCVASMDAFVQTLDRLSGGNADIAADSGPEFSPLLRPFETDSAYITFAADKPYAGILSGFTHAEQPIEVAYSMVGDGITPEQAESLTASIYYVVSSLAAMGIDYDAMNIFSLEEYNRMWQVDNLRQYLSRTATTISSIPAGIASDLVWDLIETTDDFIDGSDPATIYLRFGHAETIMPLASLLRLPGCCYLTDCFDSVALHWQSWHVVPMASNIQQILFRAPSGNYYLRTDLNEVPVPLIPGSDELYVPWERARYFMATVAGAD